ncbi:MAG: RNA polymerase sigma factor [Alphaproteobacteria bacterium]|nr:RNA polymerase sigma factor [Alphaproteobacteria bacterium]
MNTAAPSLTHLSDEALMRRVQGGDPAAYDTLYRRWSPRLHAFLHRRTGSLALAEEALQETFLRVHRFCLRYDATRPFKPWLYEIATNAGHDAREPQARSFAPPPVSHPDPAWVRDALVKALHVLDPQDRRLFLLVVEGFDAATAGRMVGLNPSTARTRLQRARARIQESLDVR